MEHVTVMVILYFAGFRTRCSFPYIEPVMGIDTRKLVVGIGRVKETDLVRFAADRKLLLRGLTAELTPLLLGLAVERKVFC